MRPYILLTQSRENSEGAKMDEELERIAGHVVDAAVKLHIRVGPGLLESVYETLLAGELEDRGLVVERQKWISTEIDSVRFDKAFRIDLLVNRKVIVEVKSVDMLLGAHWKQVLTYLRLLDLRLGFLINFKEGKLRDGLKRVVNRYDGFADSRLRVRRGCEVPNPGHPPGSISRIT